MLTLASQQKCIDNGPNVILSYIICLISGLSVPELFIDGETVIQSQQVRFELLFLGIKNFIGQIQFRQNILFRISFLTLINSYL